jgi:hypothetical protein
MQRFRGPNKATMSRLVAAVGCRGTAYLVSLRGFACLKSESSVCINLSQACCLPSCVALHISQCWPRVRFQCTWHGRVVQPLRPILGACACFWRQLLRMVCNKADNCCTNTVRDLLCVRSQHGNLLYIRFKHGLHER